MKRVSTVRLTEEELGTMNGIQMQLQDQGFNAEDRVMLRLIITVGVKVLQLRFNKGYNIFDDLIENGNDEAED